jgi:hypothetical protein
VAEFHENFYHVKGLKGVFTFMRESRNPSEPPRKVQLIVALESPLACIVSFHTSCVMNLISYECAYSLYPHATFEARRSLAFDPSAAVALDKYAQRGWTIPAMFLPRDKRMFPQRIRHIGDDLCWTVRLDTQGVSPPPPLSPSSTPLAWDPVAHNSWNLRGAEVTGEPVHVYSIVKPEVFRFRYLSFHRKPEHWGDLLRRFMIIQGRAEYGKANHRHAEWSAPLSDETKTASAGWTWCVL